MHSDQENNYLDKQNGRTQEHKHIQVQNKCWKQPQCPSVNEWIKKPWYIYTVEYCTAERNKEILPFVTAWMELESIMLSEISQAVKDKYHMISPISGTQSTKQTSKQNITRDIEIKNKLTVIRGVRGG